MFKSKWNIIEKIEPMLVGNELKDRMQVFPEYDEAIRNECQAVRLLELNKINGIDDSMYILYDNFEFIEKVQMRSIISEGNYPYNIETADGTIEVSYEEGQAKIQSIREKYQKADFKEMNEETIIATLEAYR